MKIFKYEYDRGGSVRWFLNNKRHCEIGPAVIWFNQTKYWFLNGRLHREDGPAIFSPPNRFVILNHWYLGGNEVEESSFEKELEKWEILRVLND